LGPDCGTRDLDVSPQASLAFAKASRHRGGEGRGPGPEVLGPWGGAASCGSRDPEVVRPVDVQRLAGPPAGLRRQAPWPG
jgi:hypothetical protein